MSSHPPTRKTRIILISDTHNQTPKLPSGDVLIHAGDLTNQGSYSELKKTVDWLEKADFAAKIVVGGNHDLTLDPPFYHSTGAGKFKWSAPQDTDLCRALLTTSPSITYLEHETATIYLPTTQTTFKIFGSPYSRGQRGWAFQYPPDDHLAAEKLWSKIDEDTDIVVTHTPARGFLDRATKDERTGCEGLKKRLGEVRPLVHVCGHIHEARGVERVRWKTTEEHDEEESLVEAVDFWEDPGKGSKKMSVVDLTGKTGRRIDNAGRGTWAGARSFGGDASRPQSAAGEVNATSSLDDVALRNGEAALWRRKEGGAMECRSDVGLGVTAIGARNETVMINAAFLGARIAGTPMVFNKPIVVDVELPVWDYASECSAV